jgi:hypothetical protein
MPDSHGTPPGGDGERTEARGNHFYCIQDRHGNQQNWFPGWFGPHTASNSAITSEAACAPITMSRAASLLLFASKKTISNPIDLAYYAAKSMNAGNVSGF